MQCKVKSLENINQPILHIVYIIIPVVNQTTINFDSWVSKNYSVNNTPFIRSPVHIIIKIHRSYIEESFS